MAVAPVIWPVTTTLDPITFPKSVVAPTVPIFAVADVIWPVRATLAPMTLAYTVVAWTFTKLAVDPLRPAPVPIKLA